MPSTTSWTNGSAGRRSSTGGQVTGRDLRGQRLRFLVLGQNRLGADQRPAEGPSAKPLISKGLRAISIVIVHLPRRIGRRSLTRMLVGPAGVSRRAPRPAAFNPAA